jgi:MFS family permease
MRGEAYRRYLLGILMVTLAFNYVDRLALGLLLQNIKIDLRLSDTQLGLLTGIAFALFYSVLGIPIARWADRGNRITIITLTTALWSVAVALCGTAGNFVQLLLIRIGVAVGEAGCMPPAYSLIADHYTRAERPRAVAIYLLGVPLSAGIGYFVAGWLNELLGWRVTFILLGLPGVLLAGLAGFTLKEPRRRRQASQSPVAEARPDLRKVFVTLWANRTFRHLLLAYSVLSFFSLGIGKWKAAFFIRSHGLHTGELGTWFAAIYGLGGLLGTYCGGALASRIAAHNEALQLKAMAIAFCGFGPITAGVYLASDPHVAFALLSVAVVGVNMAMAPLFATIQSLVAPHMRATSIALIYLCANLIGMGLGPLAAGALSDAMRPWAGEESLRYALLTLCPGYLWCAWHCWRANTTVQRDLATST